MPQHKKIYLHIGCQKTGTSSLQTMFALYPNLLTDAGFAPPQIRISGLGMPRIDYPEVSKKIYACANDIGYTVKELFRNTEKLFYSNEDLCGLPQENIYNLVTQLKKYNISIEIIITTRNLYDFYYSAYKEDCHFSGYHGDFHDYIRLLQSGKSIRTISYNYLKGFSDFISTGNICKTHILHYNTLRRNINQEICSILGTGYKKTKDENTSFTFLENENLRLIVQNILEKNCVPYLLHPKHLTRLIYFMYRLFSKADSRKSPQGVPYTKEIYDILNSLFQKKIDAFNNTYNTKLVILDDNTPKFSLSTEATPIDTALIDKATFCIQRFIHSLSYEDSWKYKYLHLKKLLDTHPGEHKILLRQRGENLLPQLPDSVEGLRALADIKLRIYDNPQEAIDIYQTILASKEARTNDWERILFCYQLIGDNTRAQATLRQGLGRFCTHTELLSRSAYIHYQCGNLTEALNISQQLVMRNPLSYRYTKLLYRILYSLQKHSDANDALILYENNCKLQNRKIEAAQDFFLLKGIICLLLEKWQEASQCFSNIKVSKPWFTALHSIALEQSCQIQEAVRLWKDIPDSPNWRELRGLFAIRNHIEMNTWINIGEAVLQRDSAALFLEQLFPANEKERRTWILRDVFLGKKPYEEFDPFFYITHNKRMSGMFFDFFKRGKLVS